MDVTSGQRAEEGRRGGGERGSALAAGPLGPLWTVMGWMLKHSL